MMGAASQLLRRDIKGSWDFGCGDAIPPRKQESLGQDPWKILIWFGLNRSGRGVAELTISPPPLPGESSRGAIISQFNPNSNLSLPETA